MALDSGASRVMNSALERTRATRPNLRKSEAKVADLGLADPARILESSLARAAQFAGVSRNAKSLTQKFVALSRAA